jgi:hypothetical protein
MLKLSRHTLNAILFTIIIHLLAVIVGLLIGISTKLKHTEQVILIEPEMLDESVENSEKDPESEMDEIDIERYIQDLRNSGSNYTQDNSNLRDNQNLSAEEIQKMYEENILREKYGDDYDKIMNPTPQNNQEENDNTQEQNENNNQTQVNHSGPALVYAELDDKNRATRYLNVPVFTCEGSGIIVIGITISKDGEVKNTSVLKSDITSDANCLIEAAIDAAKRSRFAIIENNETQKGKIIYQFLSQ